MINLFTPFKKSQTNQKNTNPLKDIQNPVVRHNLELMISEKNNGMKHLLLGESMGGNAGKWNEFPCMGANFFYKPETGKIKCFNNIQDLSENTKNIYYQGELKNGIFRLAVKMPKFKLKIIKVYDVSKNTLAEENIQKSIDEFNHRYGFKE